MKFTQHSSYNTCKYICCKVHHQMQVLRSSWQGFDTMWCCRVTQMFQRPCCLHPYGCRNCIQADIEVITMRMWFDYTGTRTGSPWAGHAGFSSTPEGSKQIVFSQDRIVLDSEATFPYLWPHKQVLWLPTSLLLSMKKEPCMQFSLSTCYSYTLLL